MPLLLKQEKGMGDLSKRPLVRLIDALNFHNPNANLSLNDLAISAPAVVQNDILHNTKVVLTPMVGVKTLKNKRSIFYNRLNLQTTFTSRGIASINAGLATNTHELLPLILEQTGVLLEPIDIVLEPLTNPPYILTATATSYGWLGSVSFGQTDVTVTYVHALDNGDIFGLDDGNILAVDETEE